MIHRVRLSGKELQRLAQLIAQRPEMIELSSEDVGDGDIVKAQRMAFRPGRGWQPEGPPIDITDYEAW